MAGKKTGPSPVDRAKRGAKLSLLIEGHGIPVNLVVAPANRNDCMLLKETLTGLPVPRPAPRDQKPQHLCLDKGYDFQFVRRLVELLRFVGQPNAVAAE